MDQPLAERLRPRNLDEFLGQNKILGEQSLIRKSLENDSVPSMIFWGPPGCGKTSLAHVIRQHTKKAFVALSAVASGVKEVKEVLADARKMKAMFKAKGYRFYLDSPSNQQFVVMTREQADTLAKNIQFTYFGQTDNGDVIARFVTSWSTTEEDLKELGKHI